ncbi:MAG: hypothetical protein H7Z42_23580 [Roseiflexaceae bacterium]|nr:hypothetical protein [Roseiflexaceae bacterium]
MQQPHLIPAITNTTIPLSAEQHAILRASMYQPLKVAGCGSLAIITFWSCILFNAPRSIFVGVLVAGAALILLAIFVMLGIHIAGHRADIRAGVVQVRQERLTHARRVQSRQGSPSYYADFAELGTVITQREQYEALEVGRTYHVEYSQRTRRCWKLEPLD